MNRFIYFLSMVLFLVGSLSIAGGQENLKDEVSFKNYFRVLIPPLTGAEAEALLWKMLPEGKFFMHRTQGRDGGDCLFWVEAKDAKCTFANVTNVVTRIEQGCDGIHKEITKVEFMEIYLHVPQDEKDKLDYFSCNYTGPII